MLADKVNVLLTTLDASNTAIAHFAECDASSISRLRTGARTPHSNSPTIQKFIQGVYLYAEENNQLPMLCSLFHELSSSSAKTLKAELLTWLYDDPSTVVKKEAPSLTSDAPYRFFSEKLNAVMNLLHLSNARLGKAVNLDPSHISRFRSGARTPKSNKEVLNLISHYLYQQTSEQKKQKELAALMNLPYSSLSHSGCLEKQLFGWLCDFGMKMNDHAIDRLLDHIDSFTLDMKLPLPDITSLMELSLSGHNETIYYGINGLRTAVLRFLGTVIESHAKELLLYSDQEIEWFTNDHEYRMQWLSLMCECVRNGTRIKIIHNIDRDLNEMVAAIQSWLPLYLSGMIEPYYCRKSGDKRFSHTFFLCRDLICIEACHIKGYETDGLYHCYTDPAHISLLQKQFQGLLNLCEPLLTVYTENDRIPYRLSLIDFSGAGILSLNSSLSLASMPEDLLGQILNRSHIAPSEADTIHSFWELLHVSLMQSLNDSYVYELVPHETLKEPFTGRIPVDIKCTMSGQKIFYTSEEYRTHKEYIQSLRKEYPNYSLIPLSETPFQNVQLYMNKNHVFVIKTCSPCVTFTFTNSFMYNAFQEYMNRLKDSCIDV